MPKKASDRTYGEKLIMLFAKLLFTREQQSLARLSQTLDCSKQTTLRLIDDIERSYKVQIERTMKGKQRFFRLKTLGQAPPALNLTTTELHALYMCRAFAEHLLGGQFLEESARALEKGHALLPRESGLSSGHFASFRPGTIDYTPHQQAIRTLLQAMDQKHICKVTYKGLLARRPKTFYIKPYKIFSHHETMYLHSGLAPKPGARYREPEFDPLLVMHRMMAVDMTEGVFTMPESYDFEKTFNRNFGIIKEEAFEVTIEFSGFAAGFVAERMWSPDQKITRLSEGRIRLAFSASSEPELKAWVLSFGEEAMVMDPDWLKEDIAATAERLLEQYSPSD